MTRSWFLNLRVTQSPRLTLRYRTSAELSDLSKALEVIMAVLTTASLTWFTLKVTVTLLDGRWSRRSSYPPRRLPKRRSSRRAARFGYLYPPADSHGPSLPVLWLVQRDLIDHRL